MNTNKKNQIKMSISIAILIIIIIMVFMIVIQYQIEGEQNMPYSLSKITIISTAEGKQNSQDIDQTAKWNLEINQNNDVYLFIDKNENFAKDKLIDSVTIENITVTKKPLKGEIKTFMPSSTDGRTFLYDEEYLVEEKLEYRGGAVSNPKTLEIGNQGGSAIIRFSNTNIGNFISDEDIEIKHDGTLITKIDTNEDELKGKISFDLILQIDKIKYKSNITINIPCEGISKEGTSIVEISGKDNFIFKRIK